MEIKQELLSFPAANGEGNIFVRAWFAGNLRLIKPAAIVQIAHGMSEHSGRYDEFARYFCLNGFFVVAGDYAGHGLSVQGHPGAFSAKAGGLDFTIEDLHHIFEIAAEKIGALGDAKGIPRILFGHSMGSVFSAIYAERKGGLAALVMSGTPSGIKFSRLFSLIAGAISKTRGHLARSPLLEYLTGSAANLPPAEAERKRQWLSRDPEKVREFCNDPLCGFDYTAGGYSVMLRGYHYINSKKWGRHIGDIPVLVVGGTDDTASECGKGPEKYAGRLRDSGHTKVELKLFPECRHEIINELNRQEIYKYLCDWFKGISKNFSRRDAETQREHCN